jgi:4-alpha-glucanotransferase
MSALARLCASHGIEPSYLGLDRREHLVPEATLSAFARIFGLTEESPSPPAGIAEARAERDAPHCFVPEALRDARTWGLTCQVPSLRSARNLGIGDFADLAALAGVAGAEGADFLGVNPLHAMFWSDPARVSPFSPSNRRLLNPLYLAPEWIEGFDGLTPEEADEAGRLRDLPLLDGQAAGRLKDRVLRRLFKASPRSAPELGQFRHEGGPTLEAHALFETISGIMARKGHGVGWMGWPAPFRERHSDEVRRLGEENADEVRYHLWLQWQTDRQLARVQETALRAGMRIGLYMDIAVGASPDGSSTWTDPHRTVPELKIGAPPDDFSLYGQDWGLAPTSPVVMAEREGGPLAEIMGTVMRHAGAVRIDHAMSLARLWLIPQGMPATEGAYVRYPLSILLARLAEASNAARCIVIGEDLGVVPPGFQALMEERALHSYKVWFFERGPMGLPETLRWPLPGLACLGTHDMATVAGWAAGRDIDLRDRFGMLDRDTAAAARDERVQDRARIADRLGVGTDVLSLSLGMHAHVAESPCRLAALQIEDALGLERQVNVPGTIDEYPNWRNRLPVPIDEMAGHEGFLAHTRTMRAARPR